MFAALFSGITAPYYRWSPDFVEDDVLVWEFYRCHRT